MKRMTYQTKHSVAEQAFKVKTPMKRMIYQTGSAAIKGFETSVKCMLSQTATGTSCSL